jgi:hypothetical protein
MTSPYVTFADAAHLVVDRIRQSVDPGVVVATRVPKQWPDLLIVVRRIGGPRRNLVTDEPLLSIEAWAPNEEDAVDLIEEARGLIHSLRGQTMDGVAVYRITEAAGPAMLPDPLSNVPRCVLTISVAMRGTAPGGS